MLGLILSSLLLLSLSLWTAYFIVIARDYHKTPHLSKNPSKKTLRNPPLISIIIPSRNEEHRISRCIQTLKTQTYSNLEVLIVDDSTDHTVEVIKNIVGEDKRFKIIKQKKLPDGWVGKPFALQQGSENAKGDWLLFVDADTWYDPVLIEKTMEYALENNLDMLSLAPRHICKTFWEKVIQPIPLGAIPALSPLTKVNDPKSKVVLAGGPFILIKRYVFNKIGGYQTIRSCIADDVELAKLVKTSGFRLGLVNAQSMMNLRMYERFREIWEGWSKVSFLGLVQKRGVESKTFQTLLFLLLLFTMFDLLVLPFFAILISISMTLVTGLTFWKYLLLFAFLTWLLSTLALAYAQRVYRIGEPLYAPLTLLLGGFVMLGVVADSTFKTLSGRGVTWKGRRYSVMKNR